jgi:Holliday junction resolvase RusA-like endonuclease
MISIKIKPLSSNDAWKGRRFKTNDYKIFERATLLMLPATYKVPDGEKLEIFLEFGFSSCGSDWDNPIKPFIDILQKKYGFNDNRIYQGIVRKVVVGKGEEFIRFDIKAVDGHGYS